MAGNTRPPEFSVKPDSPPSIQDLASRNIIKNVENTVSHQFTNDNCVNRGADERNDSVYMDGLINSQSKTCTDITITPESRMEEKKETEGSYVTMNTSIPTSKESSAISETSAFASAALINTLECPSSSVLEQDLDIHPLPESGHCDYFEDMRDFEQSSNDIQMKGPMGWIMKQVSQNTDPRNVISQIMPGVTLPPIVDPMTLWKIVWEILTEPKPRKKLEKISTIDDVVRLITTSKNIIVLTGAGVSVSCGIPDFRSRDGIYARLSKDFPNLPDPQSMFDIHYFRRDQRPFYKFAKEIFPGQFKPSLSHRFIAALDKGKKLLRNYTQNIDTLEQVAGIERIVQCHGSFATASCTNCKHQVSSEDIRNSIFAQVIPKCPVCPESENALAVMKPDIIFFGEGLPDQFYQKLDTDKNEADLLIVIGSSLKVRPVALIPDYLKPDVPQVLINREPLNHFNFDVELLGNCDAVICELCRRLGNEWNDVIDDYEMPHLDKEAMYKIFNSMSENESEEDSSEIADTFISMENENSGADTNDDVRLKNDILEHDLSLMTSIKNTNNEQTDNTFIKTNNVLSNELNSEIELESKLTSKDNLRNKSFGESTNHQIEKNKQSVDNVDKDCSTVVSNCILTSFGKESVCSTTADEHSLSDKVVKINDTKRLSDETTLDVIEDNKRKRASDDSNKTTTASASFHPSRSEENADNNSQPSYALDLGMPGTSAFHNHTESLTNNRQNEESAEHVSKRRKFDSHLPSLNHHRTISCLNKNELEESGLVPQTQNSSSQTAFDQPKQGINAVSSSTDVEVHPTSPILSKNALMKEMEQQDLYYLFVAPNRYIFHGAEINSSFMIYERQFDLGSDDELEEQHEEQQHKDIDDQDNIKQLQNTEVECDGQNVLSAFS